MLIRTFEHICTARCCYQKLNLSFRGLIYENPTVKQIVESNSNVLVSAWVMKPTGNGPGSELKKVPLPKPKNSLYLQELYFVCNKKMKIILALVVGLAFVSVVGACLFR